MVSVHHNGIRTRTVKKIPRTFVLGIYFVCVIVMDFHFVFLAVRDFQLVLRDCGRSWLYALQFF